MDFQELNKKMNDSEYQCNEADRNPAMNYPSEGADRSDPAGEPGMTMDQAKIDYLWQMQLKILKRLDALEGNSDEISG